jgi:hypothetical protein
MMLQNTIQSLYALTSYNELETFGRYYYSINNYHEKKLVYDRLLGLFNINDFNACYVYYPDQASVVDINSMHPLYEHISQNKQKELILTSYRQPSIPKNQQLKITGFSNFPFFYRNARL